MSSTMTGTTATTTLIWITTRRTSGRSSSCAGAIVWATSVPPATPRRRRRICISPSSASGRRNNGGSERRSIPTPFCSEPDRINPDRSSILTHNSRLSTHNSYFSSMDDDRKYRHRGYMDSDRGSSPGRRPSRLPSVRVLRHVRSFRVHATHPRAHPRQERAQHLPLLRAREVLRPRRIEGLEHPRRRPRRLRPIVQEVVRARCPAPLGRPLRPPASADPADTSRRPHSPSTESASTRARAVRTGDEGPIEGHNYMMERSVPTMRPIQERREAASPSPTARGAQKHDRGHEGGSVLCLV